MNDLVHALMQARNKYLVTDPAAPSQAPPKPPPPNPLDPTQRLMEENADIFNDKYGPLYYRGIHCLGVANGDPEAFAACMQAGGAINRSDEIEEEIEKLNEDEWEKRINPPPAPPGSVGPIT